MWGNPLRSKPETKALDAAVKNWFEARTYDNPHYRQVRASDCDWEAFIDLVAWAYIMKVSPKDDEQQDKNKSQDDRMREFDEYWDLRNTVADHVLQAAVKFWFDERFTYWYMGDEDIVGYWQEFIKHAISAGDDVAGSFKGCEVIRGTIQ